jgi:hypothetical protein
VEADLVLVVAGTEVLFTHSPWELQLSGQSGGTKTAGGIQAARAFVAAHCAVEEHVPAVKRVAVLLLDGHQTQLIARAFALLTHWPQESLGSEVHVGGGGGIVTLQATPL